MTCEELGPDYDLFAFGLTDTDESSEMRRHIRIDCPTCVPGVQEALLLVSRMGGLVKLVDPPARLRTRVLAAVKPALLEPRTRFGWSMLFAGLSIVLLVVVFVLGYQTTRLSTVRRAEMTRLERALTLMSAPGSRVVDFGNKPNQPPRGKVIVTPGAGVVLIAANLPRLEEGKTFELWLIPRGAKPIPSGLFQAQPDGTALALPSGPVPPDLSVVAVSVENDGGAPAPTTTPIIAAQTL